MKVLVVGGGGREHALVHKLAQSPRVTAVFAAPGNAGIARQATCVNIAADDLSGLVDFALKEGIDLTVVGPELPLVMGIVDAFEEKGLRIFGPSKAAAQFEASKAYTKRFLMRHGIPTARYGSYSDLSSALEALATYDLPVVIKADGLAAGKGVIIAQTRTEAEEALRDILENRCFGAAGRSVVIEAFLTGIEASVLCFVDGHTIVPMQAAQDYKRALDGDAGPNTGGMGTYSPSAVIDAARMAHIQRTILDPFVAGIEAEGIDYRGILFVGLMINGDDVRVLEYNVRFGDPEAEVILMRLENDLVEIMTATLEQRLHTQTLTWRPEHAVCVVMTSGGYPGAYKKGVSISGLSEAMSPEATAAAGGAPIFHFATEREGGTWRTSGGRVLGIAALAETLEGAREAAYSRLSMIDFEGAAWRRDIGGPISY